MQTRPMSESRPLFSRRRGVLRLVLGAGLALVASGAASGDEYAPPPGYYSSTIGLTGANLKEALRQRITTGHVRRTYADARFILPILDRDPDNEANIILVYNGASVSGVWDSGVTWNREHTWPVSRGLGSSSSFEYCDLHQLRGCNPSINSSRGNKPFGPAGPVFYDPNIFGKTYRGEMARAMMYMDTRYTHLTLVHGNPSGSQMGDLTYLLAWHFDETPSEAERRRNHLISTTYQFNRNPFADHPEFVWAIFSRAPGQPQYPAPGNPWPNESTIFLGSSPNADGSSLLSIDLGDVLLGAETPAQNVTITKTGVTPTTYRVLTVGPAEASRASHEAFPFDNAQQTMTVAFDADATDTLGNVSATVLVTNSDLTSAGLGMGAQDADDAVFLDMRVVVPGLASFDSSAQILSTNASFGNVAGASPVTIDLPVYVLPTGGADAIDTATLLVAPLSSDGDTDAITLQIPPGQILSPTASNAIVAQLDPSAAGVGFVSAVFEVEFVQNAIGVSPVQTGFITLTGVVGGCVADITGPALDGQPDGLINSFDLVYYVNAWSEQSVTGPAASGFNADITGPALDGIPDGAVNAFDLNYYISLWLNTQGVCE